MALDFAVSSTFKAKDEAVNQAFKKMARGAESFEDHTVKAFKNSSRQASHFGDVVKGILAAGAIQKGFNLLGQGVGIAGKQFLDFDQAITGASAKFTDINVLTEEGRNKLEQLRKTARLVGRDTEHNAAQAASGLDFLAMAGFNSSQSIALLPGVANLATSANIDFARATDIASDAIGAFGMMTTDTAKLAKNFTRVQDVMAKVTVTSNTNLEDFFETVKSGAPDFINAGQSIETFGTLTGVLASNSIKGEMSGMRLRNMVTKLAKPTKEASYEMRRLGVKVADQKGNFRDFLDIIEDLRVGTKKLGEVERAKALATIFDSRNTGALNIILGQTDEQLRSYRQSLIDSQGASEKMAEIMRSSLMNRLKSLGSAATELGFQLFDAFDERGANAIDRFTRYLRQVDMKPLIDNVNSTLEYMGLLKEMGDIMIEPFQKLYNLGLPDWMKKGIDMLGGMFKRDLPEEVKTPLDWMKYDIENKIKPFFENLNYNIDDITTGRDTKNVFGAAEGMRTRKMNLHEITQTHGDIAAIKSMFGMGPEYTKTERIAPPRQQQIDIGGTLNIVGAPEGSSYKPSSPAPPIDTRFTAAPQGL